MIKEVMIEECDENWVLIYSWERSKLTELASVNLFWICDGIIKNRS